MNVSQILFAVGIICSIFGITTIYTKNIVSLLLPISLLIIDVFAAKINILKLKIEILKPAVLFFTKDE